MERLDALRREIALARPGSDQGQFPILDLFGNLRDEAAARSGGDALRACCADAWEKMVQIVESGKPFDENDIAWLNGLPAQIQKLAGNIPAPASSSESIPLPSASGECRGAVAATVNTGGVLPPATASDQSPGPTAARDATNIAAFPDEDAPFKLNIAGDGDLLREFITESREHLDNIEQGVLMLENEPANAEVLNTIFRAFHTFKGSAGFLNLTPVNRLAHILESLLDLARQGKLAIRSDIIELILRGRDVLKQFLDEIEGQLGSTRPVAPILIPVAALKNEVRSAIDCINSGKTPASAPAAAKASSAPKTPGAAVAEHSPAIKVDTGKLDVLLDLVGEMVIAQSLVGRDLEQLAKLNPRSAQNVAQLSRITKELQRVSMSLRMVPIRGVFQKMARVVRDISAKQNKKVRFVTSGEDTELDRTVAEMLNDSLLHMVRNSMDHGIEPPEKRAVADKPPVGTLQLRACHQGGNIVIEIEDDGAGLNRERILAKAIERGLASAGATLSDEEVYHFIFAPGFSTADKITDLSGRGVGLDVVRRSIERLRGCVDIASVAGKGTTFKITLPLTLAIIDGLIVKVGDERYILPALVVRESFRPKSDMITRVQNRAEVVNVRGRLIPLLRLREFFGVQSATDTGDNIAVVVQSGSNLRCLLVDALLHKQEVVIKNLNEMMVHKNRALAGAAILGDGRVGLILDVNSLN